MDLGSREIVGLAMADHMRVDLTLDALNMALVQQRPAPGLMHHSDRGSQYTAHAYQQRLRDAKMVASMSRKGNCWDNAPMESFWATLKRECADRPFTVIYKLVPLFLATSWASKTVHAVILLLVIKHLSSTLLNKWRDLNTLLN